MAGEIKYGAYVGNDNPILNGGSFDTRWDRFAYQSTSGNREPLIYHDFYDQSRMQQHSDGKVRNYDDADIFGRCLALNQRTGKTHRLMLTFNVRWRGEDQAQAFGSTLNNGFTADEHVALIGAQMKAFTDAGGGFMRIRYLHEFTGAHQNHDWSVYYRDGSLNPHGWTHAKFRRLWARWYLILQGGSIADVEAGLQNAGDNTPLNIDVDKLAAHGYTLPRDSAALAYNGSGNDTSGTWAAFWCAQSDPVVPNNGTNTYADYYPGNWCVGYVGTDIYPGVGSGSVDDNLAEATKLYNNFTVDNNGRNKPYGVGEFSRNQFHSPNSGNAYFNGCSLAGANDSTTAAAEYRKILDWFVDRQAHVKFVVFFNAVKASPGCEDTRIDARNSANTAQAYPNHLDHTRTHLNWSVYGSA